MQNIVGLLVGLANGDYTSEVFKYCRFTILFSETSNKKFEFTNYHHWAFNISLIMIIITILLYNICFCYHSLIDKIGKSAEELHFSIYFNKLYLYIIIFTLLGVIYFNKYSPDSPTRSIRIYYLSVFMSFLIFLLCLLQTFLNVSILKWWQNSAEFYYYFTQPLPDFGFKDRNLSFDIEGALSYLNFCYCNSIYLLITFGFFLLLYFFLFSCEDSVHKYSLIFSFIRKYLFSYKDQERLFELLQETFPNTFEHINQPYFICKRSDFFNFYMGCIYLFLMLFLFDFYFYISFFPRFANFDKLQYLTLLDKFMIPHLQFPVDYFGFFFLCLVFYEFFFSTRFYQGSNDSKCILIRLRLFNWVSIFFLYLTLLYFLDLLLLNAYGAHFILGWDSLINYYYYPAAASDYI